MQNVKANDYMTGSAKRAVDAAVRDAGAQRLAGGTPQGSPTPHDDAPAAPAAGRAPS